ncbi:hypothetical protein BDV09DRAFT_178097 [Aspergillus tetrazonus]
MRNMVSPSRWPNGGSSICPIKSATVPFETRLMQRPCRTADGNAPSLCTVNSAHACKANALTRRRGEFRVRSPLTSGSDDISHCRRQVSAAYRMSFVRLYLILILIFIQSGISSHTNLGLTVKVSSHL